MLENLTLNTVVLSKLLIAKLNYRSMRNQTVSYKNPVQEKIIATVCEHFQISEADLISGSKFYIVYMRWLCFYLAKQNTPLSIEQIGQRLQKNRPAVYNALENITIRKKIYVQTMYDLKNIAEKAGISSV